MCDPVSAAIGGSAFLSYKSNKDQLSNTRRTTEENKKIFSEAEAKGEGYLREGGSFAQGALGEALDSIQEGARRAELALLQNNQAAAKAYIEAGKVQARGILEATDASVSAILQFFDYANAVLKPTIDQGGFAADEAASMLGIPNSRGQVVPFDFEKLMQTPGAQFRRAEMDRTLQNTAAWKEISSQQMNRAQERGNQLAAAEYESRLGQLQPFITAGNNAESNLAGIANNMGIATGNTLLTGGTNAAMALGAGLNNTGNLMANQGANLANLWMNTGTALAGIHGASAELGFRTNAALTDLAINSASGQAGLNANMTSAQNANTAANSNLLGSIISTIPMMGGAQTPRPSNVPWTNPDTGAVYYPRY